MKHKLLCFLAAAIFSTNISRAQCTPDLSITRSGVYPSSLPHANVGSAYSQVLQVRVIKDTTVSGYPATIDSIRIISIAGMPAGFSFQCNNSTCTWAGNGNGCIMLSAPPPSNTGNYPLSIYLTIYGKVFNTTSSMPDTLTNYHIVIDPVLGVENSTGSSLGTIQNLPNPFSWQTEMIFTLAEPGEVEFKVYNILGKSVYHQVFHAKTGANTFFFNSIENHLQEGMYIYSLSQNNKVYNGKMLFREE